MNEKIARYTETNFAPAEVIAGAQEQAKALMDVVESQGLFQPIRGKKFLRVEAWQLLASFVGLSPRVEWTRRVEHGDTVGWEARCVVLDKDGREVAAGEAMCLSDEPNWRGRPEYMLRSMAQTRAISRAIRSKLAFVAVLAGYEATPAEEMDGVESGRYPETEAEPEPEAEAEAEAEVEAYDPVPDMKQLVALYGGDWVKARYRVYVAAMNLPHWREWDKATMEDFAQRLELLAEREAIMREGKGEDHD